MNARLQTIRTGRTSALFALLAIAAGYSATPAAAHTEQYYTSHMCKATDRNGVHHSSIRFESGLAVNRHNTGTLFLRCPVPYRRNTGNLSVIRVRLQARDQSSVKSVVLRICEVSEDGSTVSCPISAQARSGVGFDAGSVVLSAALTPSANTRWVFLDLEIPDRDSQTGLSSVVGYRVCRGSC